MLRATSADRLSVGALCLCIQIAASQCWFMPESLPNFKTIETSLFHFVNGLAMPGWARYAIPA